MDFESLKKIPHSLEAEKALIGGIFYNSSGVAKTPFFPFKRKL